MVKLDREDERGVTLAIASYFTGKLLESDVPKIPKDKEAVVDLAVDLAERLVKKVLK